VDHFRKASSAPLSVDPSDLEDQADESRSADQSAVLRDDHRILQKALGRLDREDREVLLLSRLQELSFAEVASVLECSVGAARVRAHRALKSLRGHYFNIQKENPT
jgi:RNA polymerase sigma-70 factor (ECF subfamily)